MRETEMFFLRY